MLAANNKVTHVFQHQLLTIVAILADHDRLIITITLGNSHPCTTRNAREPVFALQDAGEVQVDIFTQFDDTVVAQGIDKLLFGVDGDHPLDSLCHLRSRLGILIAYTVIILLGLLALDELHIGHLDDAQFDAVVVGHRLVPRLTAEMILQVLRLEPPAVTGQNLVAHQAQLGLGETAQVMGVHQIVLQHPAHLAFVGNLLLCHAVLQIVGSEHQCIATVTIGFTDGEEVHALLPDIVDTISQFSTNEDPAMRISRGKRVASLPTIHFIEQE